jgi:hypothetical protein
MRTIFLGEEGTGKEGQTPEVMDLNQPTPYSLGKNQIFFLVGVILETKRCIAKVPSPTPIL